MTSDTPIREVIAQRIHEAEPNTPPWHEAIAPRKNACYLQADAVLTALAALTDVDVNAAVTKLRDASFYEALELVGTDEYREKMRECDDAERNLKAIIATRFARNGED